MLPARGGHGDRGGEWGGEGPKEGCHKQLRGSDWGEKQQDSLLTPAGVVMGKPSSAPLPDRAILGNVGKFMCTHLYVNVDKKLKQF